jgi:Repeat of Unknown Function (DUF347)
VLTRPLGAALGDLLSKDRDAGGVELGATATSVIFGAIIAALVLYLTLSHFDQIGVPDDDADRGAVPANAVRARARRRDGPIRAPLISQRLSQRRHSGRQEHWGDERHR